MTEDEAKKKWCPFTRLLTVDKNTGEPVSGSAAGYNRMPFEFEQAVLPSAVCIGSQCMAWRWERAGGARNAVEAALAGKSKTDGHCGLAGE
jgi:hypothetical protein